jgi:signal peptidase I
MFKIKKRKDEPEKEKLGFFRENIEALAVAIVMALTVKMFAIEAYKVPTESMEPTIVGRASGGDRLIVNKFVYQLRDPRRWEVVVFQYPHNTLINYVKRAVGMPNEWVFIRNGDIYTAPGDLDHEKALGEAKICRKPADLQHALFDRQRLIPPMRRDLRDFERNWELESGDRGRGTVGAQVEEERLVVRAADGLTMLRFRRDENERRRLVQSGDRILEPNISNRRFDDWSPYAPAPGAIGNLLGAPTPGGDEGLAAGYADEVGDLRLRLEVEPEKGAGEARFEIHDGTHDRPIILILAVEGSDAKSRLLLGDEEIAISARLPVGESTRVSLANWDDTIEVQVDGDVVLEKTYDHAFIAPVAEIVGGGVTVTPAEANAAPQPLQPTHDLPHDNFIAFGFEGGRAYFSEIELGRDVYYTLKDATDFRVPAESYFMLGDNSANSLDARGWRVAEIDIRNEEGELVTLRGDAEGVGGPEPRPGGQPFHFEEASGHRFARPIGPDHEGPAFFVDHFGNTREIDAGKIEDARTLYGHFVHRRFVVGRAYLTFWPPQQWGIIR